MDITITYETERACGYRHPSSDGLGLYLMGEGTFEPCERLPFPLAACPCCGGGIKPSRGYTWINPGRLFHPLAEPSCCVVTGEEIAGLHHNHATCYLCNAAATAGVHGGLIWIGEKFYKTADDFMAEARVLGISRKIGALPTGFEFGKTVVYLAHRKTFLPDGARSEPWGQAVFTAFKPIRLDIVIDDPDQVPSKAIELATKLGDVARIVKVIPDAETQGSWSEDW